MPDDAAYTFDAFRHALPTDWWANDSLLQTWLAHSSPDPATLRWVALWGRSVAGALLEAADQAEQWENRPRLAGEGPYDNGQRIVLPPRTERALAQVHGSGLWNPTLDERARYAAVYLLNQNGEGGVACSVACTDGLIRVLRRHPSGHESVLRALEGMPEKHWSHGAQFVTEIQGGSDAGTNAVRAEPQSDGSFALHGQKWFCSNATAHWWLVTARPVGAPAGSKGVALFLVRSEDGGYTFERLKEKVGTRALATAEIQFHGTRGRPVGPLDEGLKTMVADVLVTSRVHNVVAAAGFLRRAQREVSAYAHFRTAFGSRLEEMPLVADVLARLAAAADHAEAGAFATVDAWIASRRPDAPDAEVMRARILVAIAKAVATRRATGLLHEAITVLGGNGIEERFSVLPRLWRDSVIMETWEGPYTLLLSSALADLRRAKVAGREADFLRAFLGQEAPAGLVAELSKCLASSDSKATAVAWRACAHRLYEAWEEVALRDLSATVARVR